MEFFIKKNATLPLLKMQIVKDGRSDYNDFANLIEKSTISFSMVDTETGVPKIISKSAGFVSKVFIDPDTPKEYYIFYKFSKKDTNKIGRYEGQFALKNDEGNLIVPIREKLYINVVDSLTDDEGCCSGESYIDPCPDCPSQTPQPSSTPTPTPSSTPPSGDIDFDIVVDVSDGSLICDYKLFSSRSLFERVSIPVNLELGSITGGTYIIPQVTLFLETGNTFSQTILKLDDLGINDLDYSYNLTAGPSSISSITHTIITHLNFIISTPTLTPTITNTPTVSPSPSFIPLSLILTASYEPGSIIATYNLSSNKILTEELTVTFENILPFFTGSPITIFTGVTIPVGGVSGQTIVTVDADFTDFTGFPLFSQLSGVPIGATYEIILVNPPTPTPTNTLTPTPTPTPSSTPEIPVETLIDPIITDNDEYISVGGDFYLQFIDEPTPTNTPSITPSVTPTITPSSTSSEIILDAILTNNGEYIEVGPNQYLKFVE